MNVTIRPYTLHPTLRDGSVVLCCYLSNFCDERLDGVMQEWVSSADEVSISQEFALRDALDSAIEMNEMPAHEGAIDADEKPLFDAMRSELVAMIERIDGLTFKSPQAD